MNSRHQGFKKLVLGTTLMCCAGMSTVEAGPWDWLKNLFAGGEIAKLSKDVVRLERKVKFLERSNKVKAFIIVAGEAVCVVAGYYYFFKKQPDTAENAIQIGEALIPLQQEEETPVLALEEEQGETQVQDLNTAENETRTENEAPVQPRVVFVIDEAQNLALCIENAKKENRVCRRWALLVRQERKAKVRKAVRAHQKKEKIIEGVVNDLFDEAWAVISKREHARKKWLFLVTQKQKRDNLKATLKSLYDDLRQYESQLGQIYSVMSSEKENAGSQLLSDVKEFIVSQQRTIQDLVQIERDHSRTIKLQAETIRNMSIIILNGERIAMEILERCGQNFVPTQEYNPRLDEIENQNTAFLSSHQGFPLVQYVPSTSEQDVETKSEVKNLNSSLDIWNQCLSGVEKKENQSEEAIVQAQARASAFEVSLAESQAKTLGLEKRAKELSEANVALQNQNKVLTEKNAAITKEIIVVRASSVDRAKVIEEIRKNVAGCPQKEGVKSLILPYIK